MTVARVLVTVLRFAGRDVLPELRRAGYEVHMVTRRLLENACVLLRHEPLIQPWAKPQSIRTVSWSDAYVHLSQRSS